MDCSHCTSTPGVDFYQDRSTNTNRTLQLWKSTTANRSEEGVPPRGRHPRKMRRPAVATPLEGVMKELQPDSKIWPWLKLWGWWARSREREQFAVWMIPCCFISSQKGSLTYLIRLILGVKVFQRVFSKQAYPGKKELREGPTDCQVPQSTMPPAMRVRKQL